MSSSYQCPKKHMKDALDRFAHCFISPLLRQSSIDREVNPVDTEFLESLSKDDHRLEQFLTLLTKKGHPLGTFSWGNKVSLVDKSREAGVDLRQELVDFYDEYFRAENMTLAVQAQTDFETVAKVGSSFLRNTVWIEDSCREATDANRFTAVLNRVFITEFTSSNQLVTLMSFTFRGHFHLFMFITKSNHSISSLRSSVMKGKGPLLRT